jgi:hypothetical protein
VTISSFNEFLRSFVDIKALENNYREKLTHLKKVKYVRPVVRTASAELGVDQFIQEILLNRFTPRLVGSRSGRPREVGAVRIRDPGYFPSGEGIDGAASVFN